MPSFPSYAKILLEGFAEKRESALIRTEMESGPPKQARIKSRVMITRPVTIRLDTLADYNAFCTWYRADLHDGADWFAWNDPISGTSKNVRFTGDGMDSSPLSASSSLWLIRGLKIEGWGV